MVSTMTEQAPQMTRYLLGELSDAEQEEFEARYFEDPRLFSQLADLEDVLVDDYVRARLTPEVRGRFETHYLADPARRARVRFAEALVTAVDRAGAHAAPSATESDPARWLAWLNWFTGPRLVAALAAVLLAAAGAWLAITARRAPPGSGTAVVRPSPAPTPGTPAPQAPPPAPVLSIVTLSLVVGPGERSGAAGEPPTLTIPSGTDQVVLALTLREHDYARYRVIVRAIGGAEVTRTRDLTPAAAGQPAFTITMPAARVAAGDYLLTLRGASTSGAFEDLSQTIFRVR
jgi:hypothetical protein